VFLGGIGRFKPKGAGDLGARGRHTGFFDNLLNQIKNFLLARSEFVHGMGAALTWVKIQVM
jgi:hypothetical protein